MKYLFTSKLFSSTSVLLVFIFSIMSSGCKSYYQPTSLKEALTEQKGLVKVTMVNGEEYIFEALQSEGTTIYGIGKTRNGEERILLKEEDVKQVRRYNKSASTVFTLFSLGVLAGSGVLLGTML